MRQIKSGIIRDSLEKKMMEFFEDASLFIDEIGIDDSNNIWVKYRKYDYEKECVLNCSMNIGELIGD